MEQLEWLALAVAVQQHGVQPEVLCQTAGCTQAQARQAVAALQARGTLEPGTGRFCGQISHLPSEGMTNHLVRFALAGEDYLLRIPGEGTASLLNRWQEYDVYQALAGHDISDRALFFDPALGYKITGFITDVHACNPACESDVAASMALLRRMHGMELRVEHRFDPYEKMKRYAALCGTGQLPFEGWRQTVLAVQGLRDRLECCPRCDTLCHIDPVHDNFLVGAQGVNLIDWEYSAMYDPDIDPAMFCIYAGYNQAQTEHLLELYHQGQVSELVRFKTYAYMAVGGLLWSYWCEYKKKLGVHYAEYEAKQYAYARDFSALAAKIKG